MWYFSQVGRALSRLFNALMGGEGDVTFSAYSYELSINEGRAISRTYGALRVAIVDFIAGKGHCAEAWRWHHEHKLFEIEK
jgi:hypothetical protein